MKQFSCLFTISDGVTTGLSFKTINFGYSLCCVRICTERKDQKAEIGHVKTRM